MTEKDLKKLNRYQLLELLIVQTQRTQELQAQVEALEKQLEEQQLEIASLGSIAEASLKLSGTFQSAQKAADMYIDAAKKQSIQIRKAALKKAAEILAEAKEKAGSIKGEL